MKRAWLVIGVLLLVSLMARPPAAGAQGADPLTVWRAWEAAANRADADGMAALFAEDGTFVDTLPTGGPGVWQGRAQIQAFFKELVHAGDRWESSDFLLGGAFNPEHLTVRDARATLAPGPNLPPGLPLPIVTRMHLIVHNGRIQTMISDNDPAWLARAGALGAPPGPGATPAPLTAWRAWEAAANRADADGMAALFAEDGTFVDTLPSGGSGVWQGRAQIQTFFKELVHAGDRWEVSDFLLGGAFNPEHLTVRDARAMLAPGPNLPPGLPLPIVTRMHVIVHDGRIQTMISDNDPVWLARAGALGAPPGSSPGMPTTGAGAGGDALWLLLLGVLACGAGGWLRRGGRPRRHVV